MKIRTLLIIFALFALMGCSVNQSVYKRIELPSALPEATQRSIANEVFASLRSKEFASELSQKFPGVTPQQLALTDMRWDVVSSTSSGRSFFISFGVKNTKGFPEAESVVDFAMAHVQRELDRILANARAQEDGKGPKTPAQ
jgi:hypothetical protein